MYREAALADAGPPKSATSPRAKSGTFKFIDLFAGIGGLRIGFEKAGGHCVFTSEWDPYAQATYSANHHDSRPIAGDITAISAGDIPAHDVLLAGFPCQPFSIAGVSKKNALGRPHGFRCETQGTLFFDVERIISTHRPTAFLLENVKNLRRHDKGRTFSIITSSLQSLGYDVSPMVIDGKGFVPQHRERILIVGFRSGLSATPFDWQAVGLPDPNTGPRLESILHKPGELQGSGDDFRFVGLDGQVNPKYTLTGHLWQYLQAYAAKHRAAGNGFGFGLVRPCDVARTLSARYFKDGSEILVDQGSGCNPRRLTPRECARLMGYPDSFRIPVSDTRAYKQFGNSVIVPLVVAVAKAMAPLILQAKAASRVRD
jgi:DNA (cytosine-5)-methyltransferase 1